MRIAYDTTTDTLYAELADRPPVRSVQAGRGLTVGLDATDRAVGLTVEHWSTPPAPLTGSPEAWAAVARQLEAAAPLSTRPR